MGWLAFGMKGSEASFDLEIRGRGQRSNGTQEQLRIPRSGNQQKILK